MPFKKGESGNPAGRPPKKKMYSEVLRELLESNKLELKIHANGETKIIQIESEGKNLYEGIAIVQIREALDGNLQAIKDISDRVDGKPHQTIQTDNTTELVDNRNLGKLTDKELSTLDKLTDKIGD